MHCAPVVRASTTESTQIFLYNGTGTTAGLLLGRAGELAYGVIPDLEKKLKESNVTAEVTGRRKHVYSIASKIRRRGVDVAQLYDAFSPLVLQLRE